MEGSSEDAKEQAEGREEETDAPVLSNGDHADPLAWKDAGMGSKEQMSSLEQEMSGEKDVEILREDGDLGPEKSQEQGTEMIVFGRQHDYLSGMIKDLLVNHIFPFCDPQSLTRLSGTNTELHRRLRLNGRIVKWKRKFEEETSDECMHSAAQNGYVGLVELAISMERLIGIMDCVVLLLVIAKL